MKKPVDPDRGPTYVDSHVGRRIRLRRKDLKVSQERLAEDLGLTFQQIQKYERGANRVSASKLYDIARSLNSPVSYFFEGLTDPVDAAAGMAEPPTENPFTTTFLTLPEGLELAELFAKIKQPKIRRRVLELVRLMAEEDEA